MENEIKKVDAVEDEYAKVRKNFIETYINPTKDPSIDVDLLVNKIPDIVNKLLYGEFNVNFSIKYILPITFITTWIKLIQFIQSQPEREFALNVAGLRVAYATTYEGGDKSNNITPICHHVKTPVFIKQHPTPIAGSDFMQELNQKYNKWRSVNIEEIVDSIERNVHSEVLNTFGVDLICPQTVLTIVAAFYAVGIQLAKEQEGIPINMYNVYQIIYKQGHVIINPLALIKQSVKGDGKNALKEEN
jgi:hypothetical protein